MVLQVGKRTINNLLRSLSSSRQSSAFPLWRHHRRKLFQLCLSNSPGTRFVFDMLFSVTNSSLRFNESSQKINNSSSNNNKTDIKTFQKGTFGRTLNELMC